MNSKIYKNILWLGVAALVIFPPIARGAVRIWSITPVLLIEFTLIFLWLWRLNNSLGTASFRGQPLSRPTPLDLPIFLFTLLAVISFIFSIYKHDSFYALPRLLGYVGIYHIVVNEFDKDMVRRLIALVIFVGAALSLYGLLQYFGVLTHSWWFPEDFLSATFVNHNHFAGYLELALPVTVAMVVLRRSRSILKRLWLIVSLVIMVSAFILSQSRGAWMSFSVSLFVMAVVLLKKEARNKKLILTLILLLIAAASVAYFSKDLIFQRIRTMTAVETVDESLDSRLKIWQGAVGMIKENPLIGTGIGTFVWGFNRYRPEGLNVQANFAHNDYLNMAAEMGIFAPLLMIWLFIVVIKTGLAKNALNPYVLGCSAGILSLALHGLVDFNFHIPSNMLLFTLYAAIVMRVYHSCKDEVR